MSYNDFNLNPQEFEQIAREYDKEKTIKMMQDVDEEVSTSKRELDFVDILIGFKILERLFFSSRERSKNPRLLEFVNKNSTTVERLEKEFSVLGIQNEIKAVDFEYPEDDSQTIKMMSNLVASEVLNLTNFIDFIDVKEHRDLIIKAIGALGEMIKDLINIKD